MKANVIRLATHLRSLTRQLDTMKKPQKHTYITGIKRTHLKCAKLRLKEKLKVPIVAVFMLHRRKKFASYRACYLAMSFGKKRNHVKNVHIAISRSGKGTY